MIEAIMKIGNLVSGKDEKEGLFSTLVDNPNTDGRYKKVILRYPIILVWVSRYRGGLGR